MLAKGKKGAHHGNKNWEKQMYGKFKSSVKKKVIKVIASVQQCSVYF